MSDKHVFISYIREDANEVGELQSALEAAGYSVWRDTKDLWPGDNWELKIRQAIQSGSLVFLGCFSSNLRERDTSYQYAELMIAADEYRLRPMDTNWLMTVRFDECEIPPVDLGGGRSLDRTINRLDLFGKQLTSNVARLVASIQRVIDSSPGVASREVLQAVADSKLAEGSVEELRALLRNPTLVMDYDEYMLRLRAPVLAGLRDRERFPISGEGGTLTVDMALAWAQRIQDYEALISSLLEPIKLVGMYGQPGHSQGLTETMRAIGQESIQSEGLDFFRVAHEYPAVALTYVVTLAGMVKQNYATVRAAVDDAAVSTPFGRAVVPFIAMSGANSVEGNWRSVASLLCLADDGKPMDQAAAEGLLKKTIGARHTPISDHLFSLLAPLFHDQFQSDNAYADAFDRAEVLLDAVAADTRLTNQKFYGGNGGYGRYTWRHRHSDAAPEVVMLAELEAAGAGWTPLMSGLFGGEVDRAKAALENVIEMAKYIRQKQW